MIMPMKSDHVHLSIGVKTERSFWPQSENLREICMYSSPKLFVEIQ